MNQLYAIEEDIQSPHFGSASMRRRLWVMKVQSQDPEQNFQRADYQDYIPIQHPAHKPDNQATTPENLQQQNPAVLQYRALGQIERSADGSLYERLPNQLRPLSNIVKGQNGKLYEVVQAPDQNHHRPAKPGKRHRKPRGLIYDRLFPNPGVYVRLPGTVLTTNLGCSVANTAGSQHSALFDCLLQAYHILRPIHIQQLAKFELGDPNAIDSFRVMTNEAAKILGLPYSPDGKPPSTGPDRLVLQPGQQLFRLELLGEPGTGLNGQETWTDVDNQPMENNQLDEDDS